MINIFLVIFFNQKIGFILNPICKVSLSILPTTFLTKKKTIFNKGQSLATNWFIASLLQPTMWQLIKSSMCTLVT
jgi:hypothetical protein